MKKKIGFANWDKEMHAYNKQLQKAMREFKSECVKKLYPESWKEIEAFNKFRRKHGY